MDSAALTIEAPAKINLLLRITGRRPDGYHELISVMQKLQLADTLTVRRTEGDILLSSTDPGLPLDEGNLAWRAARLFLRTTGCGGGVSIALVKRIPVAAGLGGGSSDAAAVLLALDRLCRIGLGEDRLADLGVSLGADVPFFVRAAPAALARGIGEQLSPASGLTGDRVLLVNPGFPVSTRWVYENLALTSGGNAYILAPGSVTLTSGISGPGGIDFDSSAGDHFVNDLESVTIGRYPEIDRIKRLMSELGARVSLMSGSGPTVFGLFPRETEAQAAFRHFQAIYPEKVFLTEPRPA